MVFTEILSSFAAFLQNKTILAAAFCILLLKFIIDKTSINKQHVKFASHFTGPAALPLFGNSLQFLVAGEEAPTKLLHGWTEKYGSIFRIWLGNSLMIVISDVDYLQDIFMKKNSILDHPTVGGFRYFFGKYSLAFMKVNEGWKQHRHRLESYFTHNILKTFIPKINGKIEKMLETFQQYENQEIFDPEELLFNLILDILTATQFEYEMDSSVRKNIKLQDTLSSLIKINVFQILFPWMNVKFFDCILWRPILSRLRNNHIKYVKIMIDEKCSSIRKFYEDKLEGCEGVDMSSFLWSSYKVCQELKTNDIVLSDALTMLHIGRESTSVALSFILLMIAMHSTVQEKLYEEIREVFGEDDRSADYDDIKNLSFMDKVIKETYRRIPLVPNIFRCVQQDTKIGPYVFPAGTDLLINIFAVHLDPAWYPNPYEFNPNHFDDDAVKKRPKHSFMPFGAGSRDCIGKVLANIEIKLIIVAILKRFALFTPLKMEDLKFRTSITIHNRTGYPISLKTRLQKRE